VLYSYTRSWWYEDYHDGLPYTQLTNLLRAARVERNWTNFYHLCRDNIPSPSTRVWLDAVVDLCYLVEDASGEQYDFMVNDPLFPVDYRDWLESLQK